MILSSCFLIQGAVFCSLLLPLAAVIEGIDALCCSHPRRSSACWVARVSCSVQVFWLGEQQQLQQRIREGSPRRFSFGGPWTRVLSRVPERVSV